MRCHWTSAWTRSVNHVTSGVRPRRGRLACLKGFSDSPLGEHPMIQARALAETRGVCPALLGRLSWLVAVALALTLNGCEAWSPTASSNDPREQHVLTETARFAKLL